MTLGQLAAIAVLALAPAAVAAQPQPPAPPSPVEPPAPAPTGGAITERPVQANGDLLTTLRADGRFATLVKGLEATNLAGLLGKQPNLTVFAPTDRAFGALPKAELDQLMSDKAGLQKLLIRHLINARVDASKIKGAKGPVPSVAGDNLLLDGSGETLRVDDATILQADVMASNGVLHVVDAVLQPGDDAAPQASAGS